MIRDDSGKLVLESAIVFPTLFMLTIGILLLAVGTGIHSALFIQAESASARAAYAWDNSHRNPITGAFYPGMYDDLYWRLTSDYGNAELVHKKLNNTLSLYGAIAGKQGHYVNRLWDRTVSMTYQSSFNVKDYESEFSSKVVEPVEWIRNVELVRSYWPVIHKSLSRQETDRMIDDIRNRPQKQQQPLAFQSHNEARLYLQQTVNGVLSREDTEEIGEWRMIDALDSNRISHQAYFGMKKYDQDMKEQMLKDAELLRKGKVNGVVWHFFRRKTDGSLGLNQSLRTQLEKRGIVIVIHE